MKSEFRYIAALAAAVMAFSPVAGALGQGDGSDGVVLHKTVTPTPDSKGVYTLTLESYVTGTQTTVVTTEHVPCDIICVLDLSGSMKYDFKGNSTNNDSNRRITALKNALTSFVNTMNADVTANYSGKPDDDTHRISIVGYSEEGYLYSVSSANKASYKTSGFSSSDYRNSLISARNTTGLNAIITSLATYSGTYPQKGLSIASSVLANRPKSTYVDTEGKVHDRAKVVIFFTDGFPGSGENDSWLGDNLDTFTDGENNVKYANLAIAEAKKLKNSGVKVYSIGVSNACDEKGNIAYDERTSGSTTRYYPKNAAMNAYMQYVSSNFDSTVENMSFCLKDGGNKRPHWDGVAYTESTYRNYSGLEWLLGECKYKYFVPSLQTAKKAVATNKYYYTTQTADGLNGIFAGISKETTEGGATIELNEESIVLDNITSAFTIPSGTQFSGYGIKVYTADCTGKSGGTLSFGTKKTFANPVINTEEAADGSTNVTVTNFDFAGNWCGDHNGTYSGKKLIIEIPIIRSPDAVGGPHVYTNGSISGIYSDDVIVDRYEIPELALPINLKIKKTTLLKGESAMFIIQKKVGDEWVNYSSVVLTGNGDPDQTVQLINLDPAEYRVRESGWSWTYAVAQDDWKYSSEYMVNPFNFSDGKRLDISTKNAESVVRNDFGSNKVSKNGN